MAGPAIMTEILGYPIEAVKLARKLCYGECRAGRCKLVYKECGSSWPSCNSGWWESSYLTMAVKQLQAEQLERDVTAAIVGGW